MTLEALTQHLNTRIAREVAPGRTLSTNVREREAYLGTSDRWAIRVVVAEDSFVLSTLDPETSAWRDHPIRSLEDLDAHFHEIADAVRAAISQLTVHRLKPGRRYRIARDFNDFQGQPFETGEELVFEELQFLPHDDGYTLCFVNRRMYISGQSEEYARFGRLVTSAE